jgi:hypothetical protein
MYAAFVALAAFQRFRADYLDGDSYKELQQEMMRDPEAGDVIRDTGGLRKLCFADNRRGKGKRGGLRVIDYWNVADDQFWLFTLYDKDEAADLSPDQRARLKRRLLDDTKARSTP